MYGSSGGKMVRIATFRSYKGAAISLYTIVDFDFREVGGSRIITRAGATMTYTEGEVPYGSRFSCQNTEPRVSFSGDKIYLDVEVTLDYGDFFVAGDDNYETRRYYKGFDPFSTVSIVD